ncbi:RES family NAD+ phosphorylase [Inquilinus sp. CAU 1745]|uniref:RES family NAD+ phosphorylase n=1 Tax=Inquilinus sp. CAU 1745 TaxID=3140369 RepID=UPI00325B9CFE
MAGDSRFCTKKGGYSVLYAAEDFATAFVETVVRDSLVGRTRRRIRPVELTARCATTFASVGRLALLDLRNDGCVTMGAPTDAVGARNHSAGRALGRSIHDDHPHVDGILYASRLNGRDCYAIFDRAVHKLGDGSPPLSTLEHHPELPAVLRAYRIEIAVS